MNTAADGKARCTAKVSATNTTLPVVQVSISLLDRRPQHGATGAEARIPRVCLLRLRMSRSARPPAVAAGLSDQLAGLAARLTDQLAGLSARVAAGGAEAWCKHHLTASACHSSITKPIKTSAMHASPTHATQFLIFASWHVHMSAGFYLLPGPFAAFLLYGSASLSPYIYLDKIT